MMATVFEPAWVRYCLSGTLITAIWAADRVARRGHVPRAGIKAPRWMTPLIIASVGGFYALIGPTGGPLFGGAGNLAGIALAALACVARQRRTVRYPDLSARGLFYVALPLAVGVPWGLLVLSVPACAASLFSGIRADRMEWAASGDGHAPPLRYRLLEGVW